MDGFLSVVFWTQMTLSPCPSYLALFGEFYNKALFDVLVAGELAHSAHKTPEK